VLIPFLSVYVYPPPPASMSIKEDEDVYALLRAMCSCGLLQEAIEAHQTMIVDSKRLLLEASHLLAMHLFRRDMWIEARQVSEEWRTYICL
jgi:hypothetical protein